MNTDEHGEHGYASREVNKMTKTDGLREESVSWQVDEIDVNATLTHPSGEGPFPAVIMVAGSGPTDRNWNSPLIPGTNGSAALLAQVLAASGFVTLRYDKRASGPHAQENVMRMIGKISMQGHVDELAGGVQFLATRPEVDSGRLFALTNSEGCIHALNYQAQAAHRSFTGLVLTAAPARVMSALARAQIAAQLAPLPGGDALLATYDAAIADFAAGRPVNVDDNLPDMVRNLLLGVSTPVNQPFARELWVTDAAALLAGVTAPVVIVIGKKDLQVDWQADGVLFETLAQTHPNITIAYPEFANHVLKHEPRDRFTLTAADALDNYSGADGTLDPETVQTIISWLEAHH